MLYREIIAVCSQIYTKHINTLCGQNVELLNVKYCGTCSDQWTLKGKYHCRVRLKCDGRRWRTGGEVKGKLPSGVGSQYHSHDLGTCVSSITNADAQTSAASRLNWRPRRFKWTRPFRRRTKSGFCARVVIFQTDSACYHCCFRDT